MNPTRERRWLLRSTVFVLSGALTSVMTARLLAAAPEVKQIRIKNARPVRVVLGARREPANGVRPDKDGWVVMLTPQLAGSSAELQDITPAVPASRWVLPVAADKLVLDSERFLPSHVYRVEFRRQGQLLGSTLIYLYPPRTERVARAVFQDDEERESRAFVAGRHAQGQSSRRARCRPRKIRPLRTAWTFIRAKGHTAGPHAAGPLARSGLRGCACGRRSQTGREAAGDR